MYAFDYIRPESIESAGAALKTSGAKLLAGGQTLIPAMKLRLNRPALLIALGRIPGLSKIERRGNALAIGATATHADVAASPVVQSAINGLARLAEGIGDPHVRNLGTIGGSVANNDPAADYPAGLLALGASLQTNKRTIAADDYCSGFFATFDDDEILTEIVFPIPRRFGYAKFPNPASRFALAGVAVADTEGGIRVAVTGAGETGVFRMPAMEAALSNGFAPGALKDVRVSPSGLMSDIHADAEYRAQLIGVLARRAVALAL